MYLGLKVLITLKRKNKEIKLLLLLKRIAVFDNI